MRKNLNRLMVLLSTLIMVLAFSLCVNAATVNDLADDYTGKTIILSTNDVHGAIDGYQYAAGLKKELESRGAKVYLVDCGDFSNGETYVSESQGASAVELMNLAGYDMATLGNHEFDFGPTVIETNMAAISFDVLCSNFVNKTTEDPVYEEGKIVDGGADLKIGFIGLATPETLTKSIPTNFTVNTILKEESFTNAKTEAAELKSNGADVVIALAHLGVADESVPYRSYDLLNTADNIDMVLDGHSHTVMEKGANDEPIMSTGTKFNNIGVTVLNDATEKIDESFLLELKEEITVIEDGKEVKKVVYREDIKPLADNTVKTKADEIITYVDGKYGAKFAESKVFLNGYRNAEKAAGAFPNGNRDGETNLGNLITDAMRWYVLDQGIDLGVPDENVVTITNGGGIRANISVGDVTKNDILSVLPFGNTIAAVTITGSELLEALEASTFATPGELGGFPHIEGMDITLNLNKAYDPQDATYPESTYYGPKSIQRVKINKVNGKSFKTNGTYVVLTNNFCAAGGDTYYAFSRATDQFDTGITMDYAVSEYVEVALGGIIDEGYKDPEGRIKTPAAAVGNLTFKTLKDAIDVADEGYTITLLKNITLGKNDTQVIEKDLTIDLNGKNITATDARALWVKSGDVKITGKGTISAGGNIASNSSVIRVGDGFEATDVVSDEVKLTVDKDVTVSSDKCYGITVFGMNNTDGDNTTSDIELVLNGKVAVSGTTPAISGNGTGRLSATTMTIAADAEAKATETYAIYHPGKGALTVNGKVEGKGGIEAKSGTLTINKDATITATADKQDELGSGNGPSTIGYAIASVAREGYVGVPSVTVNGGTVTGKVITLAENGAKEPGTITATTDKLELPDGYEWFKNNDKYHAVKSGEAVVVSGDAVAAYDTLQAAFAATQAGDTITLLNDVTLTDRLFVNAGATPAYAGKNDRYATTTDDKSLTLDLNGHDITSSSNIALAGGSLNITGAGTISTTTSGFAPVEIYGTGNLDNKRTLTIGENVVLDGTKGGYGLNVFGSNNEKKNFIDVTVNGTVKETLFVLGNLRNADNEINIVVNGSVIATPQTDATKSPNQGISVNGNANVTVNDRAVVKGDSGIEVRAGKLTVNGGIIEALTDTYSYTANKSGSTTRGAAIAVAQHTTKLATTATLNGGTLTGVKQIGITDVNNNMGDVEVVATEAFTQNSAVPEDYHWVETTTGSGKYILEERPDAVSIGTTGYKTLAKAIAAANDNDTVKLLADIDTASQIEVGKKITLDLNGKTLAYSGTETLKSGVVMVLRGGDLTVTDSSDPSAGKINSGENAYAGIALTKKGDETGTDPAKLTVNGGTIEGYYYGITGNGARHNTEITINGGTIKGVATDDNLGIYHPQDGTLNVNSGTIEGTTGIEMRAGTLNVSGGTISGTGTEYSVTSNGSGSTTKGAGIAVAQHTTEKAISVNLSGGTVTGTKPISVADPENKGNIAGNDAAKAVQVTAEESFIQNAEIPEDCKWEKQANDTYKLANKVLDDYKDEAIAKLDAVNIRQYSNEQLDNVLDAIEKAKAAIEKAQDAAAVKDIMEEATETIGKQKTNAEKDEEAAAEAVRALANAKKNANEELDAIDKSPYSGEQLEAVEAAIAEAKGKVEDATTPEEVFTAVADANVAIAKCSTDAQIAATELEGAKKLAKTQLGAINKALYSGDELKAVEEAIKKAEAAIESADSVKAVNDELVKANTVIAAQKTDEQKKAEEPQVKKAQPMEVSAKNKSFKATKLKKKKAIFKAVTVKNEQGSVTYAVKGNKKSTKALKFNKKNGKITVKKGTKKGKYVLNITVNAAGNDLYEAGTKTVKVTVKVK